MFDWLKGESVFAGKSMLAEDDHEVMRWRAVEGLVNLHLVQEVGGPSSLVSPHGCLHRLSPCSINARPYHCCSLESPHIPSSSLQLYLL